MADVPNLPERRINELRDFANQKVIGDRVAVESFMFALHGLADLTVEVVRLREERDKAQRQVEQRASITVHWMNSYMSLLDWSRAQYGSVPEWADAATTDPAVEPLVVEFAAVEPNRTTPVEPQGPTSEEGNDE